jgi:hypothetical protein
MASHDFRPGRLLSLLTAGLVTICLVSPAAAQPRISVESTSIDLGPMLSHRTADRTISIRNSGDEPLVIEWVETTCGCTAAELATKELAAGQTAPLHVTFNSEDSQGPQRKLVRIHSNDPQTPICELTLTADVHVPVTLKPNKRRFDFGRVRPEKAKSQQLSFLSTDVDELHIEPADYPAQVYTLDLEPGYEDDPHQVLLRISIADDAPAGSHRDFIQLSTNVPDQPTIDLEVEVWVVGEVFVDRERVRFGFVRPGQTMQEEIKVLAADEDVRFKVTSAEIDLPGFTAAVRERVPNAETWIQVRGEPLAADSALVKENNGRMKGTLRIHTDLPDQPVLEVPLTYMVKL